MCVRGVLCEDVGCIIWICFSFMSMRKASARALAFLILAQYTRQRVELAFDATPLTNVASVD